MDDDLAEWVEAGKVMSTAEVLAVLSGIIRGDGLEAGEPEGKIVWPTHGNILSAIDMYFKYGSRYLEMPGDRPAGRTGETGGWFKDGQGLESRGV